MKKHPDLKEMKGKTTQLYIAKKKVDTEGRVTVTERVISKIEIDGTEEDYYNNLIQVRDFMVKNGRTAAAMYPPLDEQNGNTYRNMMECVFATTNIKCVAYYRKVRRKETRKRERENTDAIIVGRAKDKTYADLLRTVKEKIRDEKDATAQIKSIRQARDGNMIIAVRPEYQKVSQLRNILTEGTEITARVSTAGGRRGGTPIHIKGMDAIATKQEVGEAIQKASGVAKEHMRIGDLRPYYGSSQAVTVVLPEEAAEKLLKARELRIGFSWCAITRRVKIVQCYRCWHYGHTAVECKGEVDRGKDCHNCGRTGHKHRTCEYEKYCPVCNRAGHSSGTGACPETRKALKQARREAERKKEVQQEERKTEGGTGGTKQKTKEITTTA